jgi:predicted DNA binding protein
VVRYSFALLKVYHPSDFITFLSRDLKCPSILLCPTLIGRYTTGLLLINECGKANLKDEASTFDVVKEFEPIARQGGLSFYYLKKVSFGVQKALADVKAIRVFPIIHERSGYKKFYILYRDELRKKLLSLVKRNAIKLGESSVYIKLKHISPVRYGDLLLRELMKPQLTGLTTMEYQALKKALELGYFDWPRSVSLREVAGALGISEATTLEHIRRGLKKILSTLLTT